MEVRRLRQRAGVDLRQRSDHAKLPLGPPSCDFAEQREVEPLVEHAEETQPRPGEWPDLGMRVRRIACAREVHAVHAARKQMYAGMPGAAGIAEARPAREHDVRDA